MARYRKYKSGITGHKYHGYYICRNSDHTYSIKNPDGTNMTTEDKIYQYSDAEWIIDKKKMSSDIYVIVKGLYNEQLCVLNDFFSLLYEKKNSGKLDPAEREFLLWTRKVRNRKAEGKPF